MLYQLFQGFFIILLGQLYVMPGLFFAQELKIRKIIIL